MRILKIMAVLIVVYVVTFGGCVLVVRKMDKENEKIYQCAPVVDCVK